MLSWNVIAGGLILIWIFMYTYSYGKWTWNKKNRLGGAAIIILDFLMVLVPIYITFFKG